MIKKLKNKKLLIVFALVVSIPILSFASYSFVKKQMTNKQALIEIENKLAEQENEVLQLEKEKEEEKSEKERSVEEERKRIAKEREETLLKEAEEIKARETAAEVEQCEEFKTDCKRKINCVECEIKSAEKYIEQREEDIKKIKNVIETEGAWGEQEASIKNHEKLIKEKEDEIDELEKDLKKLVSDECEGYKKSCN